MPNKYSQQDKNSATLHFCLCCRRYVFVKNSMEILIGIGTSKIHFGSTEEQAIEILGEPDKTFITESGCKRVQFNKHLMELSFEPDNDNFLGWLEIYDPNSILFGENIIGAMESDALKLLNEHIFEKPEITDYGSFVGYFYESAWLEIHIEFGKCSNINLGVLYHENEPVWPNT